MEKRGPGVRLTRKQTTSRPDNVWTDTWKHIASKRKEKQKWAIVKPKLENARRLRGIFFIEPDDEEFQRIMKNACKHRETCCTSGRIPSPRK